MIKVIAISIIVLIGLFDYAMCVMCIGMENTRENARESRERIRR